MKKGSNMMAMTIVGLASLVLALASGDEVGYGSFILVYSKFNLDFSEAHG